MKKLFRILAFLATVIVAAHSAWAGSRAGVITMEFDLSKQPAGKEARLWIPYLVSDADQSITAVKVSGDFA